MKGVTVTLPNNHEQGAITLHNLTPGVKICPKTYAQALGGHIFPHIEAAYLSPRADAGAKSWAWAQGGASSHASGETTDFLNTYLGEERWARDGPPPSPDLNPLDFGIWPI